MQSRTTMLNPSEEAIRIGPPGIRFLISGGDSNGGVSVFELLIPAGQKLPAPSHKNDAYEETLYGIEGVLTWTVDGTPIEVGPGQALCIPRGAAHRFDNVGGEDAKQLVVITPAIMGAAYFREAAEVINAAAGSPHDREKMTAIMRRHGMTVTAPPPSGQRCRRGTRPISLVRSRNWPLGGAGRGAASARRAPEDKKAGSARPRLR